VFISVTAGWLCPCWTVMVPQKCMANQNRDRKFLIKNYSNLKNMNNNINNQKIGKTFIQNV